MKKGDFLWLGVLLSIVAFLVSPATHDTFISMTKTYPYIMGFIKVGILATMGETLAVRIVTGEWIKPIGAAYKGIVWGFLGMAFVLVFPVFAGGVAAAIASGLLPSFTAGTTLATVGTAFFISCCMNIIFAPTMMGLHRITDTYIDLAEGKFSNLKNVTLKQVTDAIDWTGLVGFVYLKTIPFFWIPAHTITFILPPEYRVLSAAFLSIALGGILAFAKKRNT